MGRPDPGPLMRLFNKFSQSKEGQAYWEDRANRELEENIREADRLAEAAAREAHAAQWPERKLYKRGRGEATDVHPSDLVQGQHSDCFLVAAMAAIAHQHPDPDRWMREIIRDNGNGTYTVTFYEYRPGLPFNPATGRPQPAEYVKVPVTVEMGLYSGARSDDGGEKWPAVVEKAYAQAYGGQGDQPFDQRTNLGEAMERLTGLPTTQHDPKSVSIEQMDRYLQDHHAVKVMSRTGLPGLGVPHPAYAPGGLIPPAFPAAPVNPPFEPQASPVKNTELRQWHEYYVHKVDAASGTVILHNVHDTKREDIKMSYDTFQTAFQTVGVNPVYAR